MRNWKHAPLNCQRKNIGLVFYEISLCLSLSLSLCLSLSFFLSFFHTHTYALQVLTNFENNSLSFYLLSALYCLFISTLSVLNFSFFIRVHILVSVFFIVCILTCLFVYLFYTIVSFSFLFYLSVKPLSVN